MSKVVLQAHLHEGFHIPGMGEFQKQLPPNNKNLKGFKMTLQDSGMLLCEWEEGAFKKSFSVAAANVKVAFHGAEPLKAADAQPLEKPKK